MWTEGGWERDTTADVVTSDLQTVSVFATFSIPCVVSPQRGQKSAFLCGIHRGKNPVQIGMINIVLRYVTVYILFKHIYIYNLKI